MAHGALVSPMQTPGTDTGLLLTNQARFTLATDEANRDASMSETGSNSSSEAPPPTDRLALSYPSDGFRVMIMLIRWIGLLA